MPPTVEGVTLSLRAERLVLSLPELTRRARRRPSTVRPPRVSVPEIGGRFTLKPLRLIAARELLHIASAFRAQARIPVVPTVLKKGPFSIEIPEGTELVIDLGVEDSHIVFDQKRTRGVVEPAIPLPLGLTFRGVNIREDGSVVADVSKLPIDIAWIRFRKLRIPASLDEINALLIRREAAAAVEEDDGEGGLPLDYGRIVVAARDVVPRQGEFALGEAGVVELFEDSLVDVDYREDNVSVRGHLSARADVQGAGFLVRDARVFARASAEIRRPRGQESGVAVEVGCERAAIGEAAITLLDGSLFELRDLEVEGLHVWFRRLGDRNDWKISCQKIKAHLASGVFMLWIGGRAYELHLGETELEGSLTLSNKGHELDFEIQGAVLELAGLQLDLGAADLRFDQLRARATGRLTYNTTDGVDFQGVLSANGELSDGAVWAGPLRAHLLEETRASFNVTHIAGKETLRELAGTGTIELKLASGSIPIARESELGFSRGATGTVAIHVLEISESNRWPRIEAGVQLVTQSDPLVLGESLELPAGRTNVALNRIEVDPEAGTLSLGEIEITMDSDDADAVETEAAAIDENLEETVDLGTDEDDGLGAESSYDKLEIKGVEGELAEAEDGAKA